MFINTPIFALLMALFKNLQTKAIDLCSRVKIFGWCRHRAFSVTTVLPFCLCAKHLPSSFVDNLQLYSSLFECKLKYYLELLFSVNSKMKLLFAHLK